MIKIFSIKSDDIVIHESVSCSDVLLQLRTLAMKFIAERDNGSTRIIDCTLDDLHKAPVGAYAQVWGSECVMIYKISSSQLAGWLWSNVVREHKLICEITVRNLISVDTVHERVGTIEKMIQLETGRRSKCPLPSEAEDRASLCARYDEVVRALHARIEALERAIPVETEETTLVLAPKMAVNSDMSITPITAVCEHDMSIKPEVAVCAKPTLIPTHKSIYEFECERIYELTPWPQLNNSPEASYADIIQEIEQFDMASLRPVKKYYEL